MLFNNLENHKILSSFENSLSVKIFSFMFVNTFNSFFIIAFLSSFFKSLNLCTTLTSEDDCFGVLSIQMTSIFTSFFINNIPEFIKPIAIGFVLKKARKVDENPIIHPFNEIDSYIED